MADTDAHSIAVKVKADAKELVDELSRANRGLDAFEVKNRKACKAVEKEQKLLDQAFERSRKSRQRSSEQIAADADRKAARVARAAEREADAVARAEKKKQDAMNRAAARANAAVARTEATARGHLRDRVGGAAMGMGGTVAGAAGMLGLGFGVSQLISDWKDFDATMTDLAITGDKNNLWIGQTSQLIEKVSNATGKSKTEIASFIKTIAVQTGNVDEATGALEDMAQVALATGAAFEELGTSMVMLRATGVGEGLSGKALGQAMRGQFNTWAAQAKAGSVEFKSMAANMPAISNQLATVFGKAGLGTKGATAGGALFQIAARGMIGREGEAANTLVRFTERMGRIMNTTKLRREFMKSFGIKEGEIGVSTKQGFKFNDISTVMQVLSGKLAGNEAALAGKGTHFFGIEGVRMAQRLRDIGRAGWGKGIGQYASAESLFGAGKTDVIGTDAAKRMASKSFQFDQSMRRMTNAIHEHFLPAINALVNLMPTLGKVLGFVLKNLEAFIGFWISAKFSSAMAGVFASRGGVAGVAGTGGVVAAGAPVAGAAGFNWAGVGGQILAWAPAAAAIGKCIGEAFADTSFSKIKKMEEENEALRRNTEEFRDKRLKKEEFIARGRALGAMGLISDPRELGTLSEVRKNLASITMGGKNIDTRTGAAFLNVDPNKLGIEGLGRLLSQLEEQRTSLGRAIDTPGAMSDKVRGQAVAEYDMLNKAIEAIKQQGLLMGKNIENGLKNFPLPPLIVMPVISAGGLPGSRASANSQGPKRTTVTSGEDTSYFGGENIHAFVNFGSKGPFGARSAILGDD